MAKTLIEHPDFIHPDRYHSEAYPDAGDLDVELIFRWEPVGQSYPYDDRYRANARLYGARIGEAVLGRIVVEKIFTPNQITRMEDDASDRLTVDRIEVAA